MSILIANVTFCQTYFFGEGPIKWDLRKPFELPSEASNYDASDLIIVEDHLEIEFLSSTNEKISRSIKYKINTKKGLEELKHYEMPESFDFAFDKELQKQGALAKIKTPNVRDFKLKVFAARKFSRQRWANVTVKDLYQTQKWIKPNGEFLEIDGLVFQLGTLAIGDIVEIYYEVYFNSQYGTNTFYLQGPYPKIKSELELRYTWNSEQKETSFIMPFNIDPAQIYTSKVKYEDYFVITTKIQLSNLKADLFPLNWPEPKHSPYVYLDFNYYRSLVSYMNKEYVFSRLVKPKSYEWKIRIDTSLKAETTVFDKQHAVLKKFISGLPAAGSDQRNLVFMKALNDTLNNFRFISANQLFYNESSIYEMYGGEHLLKRRLPEHKVTALYQDILKENKLFYYQAVIQDKRLGENDSTRRIHFAYERNLIAFPLKESFEFFIPRNTGLKYYSNELPFYYEDALVAMVPINSCYAKNKSECRLKFIKTKASSFKENVRNQETKITVAIDSLVLHVSTIERLSGQFSTILRPLYLKDGVDSTISLYYFKNCLDIPNANTKKIDLKSKQIEAPHTYEFQCKANVHLKDQVSVSLKNWFSFLISEKIYPVLPNEDFRFDFESSDLYNFQIEFKTPSEIQNAEEFFNKIDSDYFALQSSIEKLSDTKYHLKVNLIIKQKVLPKEKVELLKEMIIALDHLDNSSLKILAPEGLGRK